MRKKSCLKCKAEDFCDKLLKSYDELQRCELLQEVLECALTEGYIDLQEILKWK